MVISKVDNDMPGFSEDGGGIRGDIAASAEVTLNLKGGSLAAILKRPLRERLGELGSRLFGAAVDFGGGRSALVLLPEGAVLTVHRRGPGRVELVMAGVAEEKRVDPIMESFLRLKIEMFKEGLGSVTPAQSSEDLRSLGRVDLEDEDKSTFREGLDSDVLGSTESEEAEPEEVGANRADARFDRN